MSDKLLGKRGCPHYKRKCGIHCSQCDEWYVCRFCHNDVSELSDDVHTLENHMIDKIVCMECGTEQSSGKSCSNCGIEFAPNHCGKCHLWTDHMETFHCDKCGLCRKGREEEHFHCDTCNLCLNIQTREKHISICRLKDAGQMGCICLKPTHSSQAASVVLACGHILHKSCCKKMLQSGRTNCPFCNKFALGEEFFNKQKEYIKRMVELTPYLVVNGNETKFLCNECSEHFTLTEYHPHAVFCPNCDHFNVKGI